MGQITSSVGLVSGINTGAIIDELMALEQEPVTVLQTQVSSTKAQQQAYSTLETQLSTLQSIGMSLELPSTFAASTATSSDPNTLTATTTAGAPTGTYQFQVARLVSAQQSVSNGFGSTSSPLQAGTITIGMGGGNLNPQTALSDLNGGAGVGSGQFRITDRSGKTDVINTTGAVTLDDIVNKINTSLDISVQASIQDNHLVLNDTSSGTGNLQVQDLAGGSTAQDLGIAQSVGSSTLTGTSINYLSNTTALSALNDGRGVSTAANGSGDFVINTAGGNAITVNVASAQTVGDVLKAINTAGNGKVTASLNADGSGIKVTDNTTGSATFSVSAINGSQAAADLGIAGSGSGGAINGSQVLTGIDTVLLRSLNGGQGLSLGQLAVTNGAGQQTTIDLSGAKTLQDVLGAINNAGAGVTASLNDATNGIQIHDSSGGTGSLSIADANGGNTAEQLGLAGTFASGTDADSGDLHLQYVTTDTSLSKYNGGKGVGTGSFTVTNSSGVSATVNVDSTFHTIGDVIDAINAKNVGVTASINAKGNGILLTDTSGGGGHLSVTSVTGTSASDLRIAGTASGTTIDGAEQTTIKVTAGETLQQVQSAIQNSGFGVSASIINDGSSQNPYRLSLTATNSGTAGRLVIDAGSTGLSFRNLVDAQDAAVFVGGTGSSQPLLVTSSTNQLINVIPGVTVSLVSASNTPVTLSITPDGSGISTKLQTFTDTFNSLVDEINTYTQYNTSTNTAGLLLGDPTTQRIQEQMYQVFSSVVSNAGAYRTLGDVGLTLGDGAKVKFDSGAFDTAFAANPDAVSNLFSQTKTGLGKVIDNSMTDLVDPVTGAITEENNSLTAQINNYNSQITHLDAVLADKKNLLETQFANMETTLATLQSQQAALASFSGIKPSTGSSASSSSSSSSSSGSSGSSGSSTSR